MVAKHLIGIPSVGSPETPPRRASRRRHRSKSRSARDYVRRLSGAWLMDVQDSFSDTAR